MDYDNYDAILHYLWSKTQRETWFKPSSESIQAGVCLRTEPGFFRVFPYENPNLVPFENAVRALNPLVAVKIRSAAVHAALPLDALAVQVDMQTRIQVLASLAELPMADKEQRAAFIRDESVLVIWSDDLDHIIPICTEFEERLMKLVWRNQSLNTPSISGSVYNGLPSTPGSEPQMWKKEQEGLIDPQADRTDERAQSALAEKEKTAPRLRWPFSRSKPTTSKSDPEKGSIPEPRPIRYFAPAYGGFAMGLSIFFVSTGISILIQEVRLDGNYTRLAPLVTLPLLLCISLFFSISVVSVFTHILGPVAQYHENSKYYSAIAPQPNPEVDQALPHVTIELPVYKESLEETIAPSVISLKKAMQSYARQGGTSAIFVHDDGMQIISETERQARVAFYANHNIGWVARPPHGQDGFVRPGRFKKASNMNYGLSLSLRMEKKIMLLEREGYSLQSDVSIENQALEMVLEEIYQESGEKWKPWALNGKSLRIGEVILIIDSDTIVPEDCFRDAARELAECPEVAIIQHESDVMQVAHHFFENGITHFTRRVNRSISMAVANGEVAPFVGHNAFLRWSAVQDASFIDPADGLQKCWSETNVSKDFDIALRLQLKGYTIRWATYSNGGFKEGVSLTVDDELNRWQKYAYGCNELLFNPIKSWWRIGPVNKQIHTFLWSSAPVHYKISMMSYMFSYYGIAASAILSLLNFLLLGWAMETDNFYLHSWEIWLACTVVFPGAGTLAFTILEFRLGKRSLLDALIESCTWIPFFFFFFSGLSIHLSTADAYGTDLRVVFVICFLMIGAIIALTLPVIPYEWRINSGGAGWSITFPLIIVAAGHILFPIVLNPWLLMFSY